jgi:diacylglycerol kinase family enzyme
MESQPQASTSPACILNGKSAHLKAALAHIARISTEFGVEPRVLVTRRGDDVSAMAAGALAEGHKPIVAGGGDGTVNAVAGNLVGTGIALGVLPMGTLNHFAKDLGIPLYLEAAVRNLFTGQLIEVDVGEVNGRVFFNNSGVGFYPHFVRQREEQERLGHVKRVAFILALRALVRRYFRLRMKVHMEGEEALERLTPFLFVGNNRYRTAGLEIGTRPRLDSGRLWICTAPTKRHRNVVHVALKILMGRENDLELNSFEAEELRVESGTARVNVSTDGEVSVMNTPLHYGIRPHALGVIVPRRSPQPR